MIGAMSTTAGRAGERGVRGDLVCGLCGRTAARVEGAWGARFVARTVRIADAEHATAVRRLRCPHCGGHLALDNQEEVSMPRGPLRDEHARLVPAHAGEGVR